MNRKNNQISSLLFCDLETSGLRPEIDHILEIAFVLTDEKLNIKAEMEAIQRVPVNMLEMTSEVIMMHSKSGLLKEVVTGCLPEVFSETIRTFLKSISTDLEKKPLLAGSGIHFDRAFLVEKLPWVLDYVHYRNLDVSTIRSCCKMWLPNLVRHEGSPHRAMADLRLCIKELAFYSEKLWKVNVNG